MSVLQFVASLAGSLAWPGTAIGLGLLFRRQLRHLMTSGPGHLLRRVKAGQFEAEWDNSIDQATADVASDRPELLETSARETPDEITLQSAYPAGAIVRAYSAIEVALYNALAAKDVPMVAGRYRPLEAVEQAVKAGIFTPAQANAFKELRKLRNQAAHSPDPSITPAQATQYVLLASSLEAAIRTAGQHPGVPTNS